MANTLIVQTAFLGDIVLTTPLIRTLKKNFPDDNLVVLTTPQGKDVLTGLVEIDGFIEIDKKHKDKGLRAFFKITKELKSLKFDRVLAAQRSYRTGLMLFRAGIPERIGFSDAKLSSLLTSKVVYDKKKHSLERYLDLLKPLGVCSENFIKEPKLIVNQEKKTRLLESLMVAGIAPDQKMAVVCPGSVWATKEWIPERFIGLIERMKHEMNISTVLAGGRNERELANAIQIDCSVPVINLAGKTSISRLIALIDRADILVTNDSGPMHIGAALKKPQVAIFGPTTPSLGYYPYNKNSKIVHAELDCRPCDRHGPKECPLEHFHCMNNISVNDVLKAVQTVLLSQVV